MEPGGVQLELDRQGALFSMVTSTWELAVASCLAFESAFRWVGLGIPLRSVKASWNDHVEPAWRLHGCAGVALNGQGTATMAAHRLISAQKLWWKSHSKLFDPVAGVGGPLFRYCDVLRLWGVRLMT